MAVSECLAASSPGDPMPAMGTLPPPCPCSPVWELAAARCPTGRGFLKCKCKRVMPSAPMGTGQIRASKIKFWHVYSR